MRTLLAAIALLLTVLGIPNAAWATIPTWSCVHTTDADGTNGVTLNVGSPSAGQLVIAMAVADTNQTNIPTPTGFSVLQASTDHGNLVTASFYLFATGSEGATVSVGNATGTADDNHWIVCKFTGAHASTAPEVGTVATGSSVNPDPPSLDPAGWATEDTLWIIQIGQAVSGTYTEPTDFGNSETEILDASANAAVMVSFRTATTQVSSLDPGTATIGTSTSWAANTIAVRPSAQSQAPRSMHQYRLRRAQ